MRPAKAQPSPSAVALADRLGWNLHELSAITGIAVSSLSDEVKSGRLAAVRYGRGRACWITRADFEAWIAAGRGRGKREVP